MGKRLGLLALVVLVAVLSIGWSPAGYVQGRVRLQGLDGGKSLVAVCGRLVFTDWNGRFVVACSPGNYVVQATRLSFLDAVATVEVTSGHVADLGTTLLIGGDVWPRGGDQRINSNDALVVETFIRKSPTLRYPAWLLWGWGGADVNGDGWVDSTDWQYTLQGNLSDTLEIVGPTAW